MAILKRRDRRGLRRWVRESIWPRMGWRRTLSYYRHRLFRAGDSTYRITAGLAAGAAVSFTPFLGFHAVLTFALCWVLRASMLAGFVGTVVGNPTTFPFIFWVTYHVGVWLFGLAGLGDLVGMAAHGEAALSDAAEIAQDRNLMSFFIYMYEHPVRLFLPLAVGGIVTGAAIWPLFYLACYYPVRAAQRAYRLQRDLRRKLKESRAAKDRKR